MLGIIPQSHGQHGYTHNGLTTHPRDRGYGIATREPRHSRFEKVFADNIDGTRTARMLIVQRGHSDKSGRGRITWEGSSLTVEIGGEFPIVAIP